MAIEVDQLIAEAVAKHGIRLDANDPAMVLVTLNRLVLEDAARGIADEIREAAAEFDTAGDRLQKAVGIAVAQAVTRATIPPKAERSAAVWALCSGAAMFVFGWILGRLL